MGDKKHSVLIVDDQKNWRELLGDLLKDEFDITYARNLEDALDAIQLQDPPFHVVITDMRLVDEEAGNEDGLKLIEYLNNRGDETKTIVITGYATVDTAVRAGIELNVSGYLKKGKSDGSDFDFGNFQQTVREAAEEAENARNQDPIDVFVLMGFDPKYDATYSLIGEVSESLGLICKRSDKIPAAGPIMEQVEDCIKRAKIIVADITDKNLNVYFEVGITTSKHKPLILIARNESDLSRLLQGDRVIIYEDSIKGSKELRSKLADQIDYLQKNSATPPKTIAIESTMLSCFVVSTDTEVGRDVYNNIILSTLDDLNINSQYVWDLYKKNTTKDITRLIKGNLDSSRVIVVDLSGRDEDVYLLGGYAFGSNRYPIFLLNRNENVPFDLRAVGKIPYSRDTEKDRTAAKNELTKSIDNLLHGEKAQKMSDSKVKVFLNHATEDKLLVRKLYAELKKHSWIDPWIDEDRLLPGQNLELEIDKAMEEADAVLVCISNISVKKIGYVQAEIRKAEEQQKRRPQGVIYMIPVLLEPCMDQVPPNLRKLLWVDISDPGKIVSIVKSLETLRR
jgi:ActR/RegA family two-component response regulator